MERGSILLNQQLLCRTTTTAVDSHLRHALHQRKFRVRAGTSHGASCQSPRNVLIVSSAGSGQSVEVEILVVRAVALVDCRWKRRGAVEW